VSKRIVPTRKAGDPAATGLFQTIGTAIEAVRQRAHEIFRSKKEPSGNALDDWLQAERELFEIPPSELSESADDFTVTVSAPGFTAEQLDIAVDQTSVTIRGKAERSRQRQSQKCLFSEFSCKEIFRRFDLPAAIDSNKVKAHLTNGYLEITLPKKTKATPTRSTTVRAA
jgi:HSP20 family molecular chaperone IbpA